MKRLLVLALWLAATPAAAKDCGAIAEPMAYNACLASQGPAARAVHVGKAPAPAPSLRGRQSRRARGSIVARHGRGEMVFSVRK